MSTMIHMIQFSSFFTAKRYWATRLAINIKASGYAKSALVFFESRVPQMKKPIKIRIDQRRISFTFSVDTFNDSD